jgi:hypothetical protein
MIIVSSDSDAATLLHEKHSRAKSAKHQQRETALPRDRRWRQPFLARCCSQREISNSLYPCRRDADRSTGGCKMFRVRNVMVCGRSRDINGVNYTSEEIRAQRKFQLGRYSRRIRHQLLSLVNQILLGRRRQFKSQLHDQLPIGS